MVAAVVGSILITLWCAVFIFFLYKRKRDNQRSKTPRPRTTSTLATNSEIEVISHTGIFVSEASLKKVETCEISVQVTEIKCSSNQTDEPYDHCSDEFKDMKDKIEEFKSEIEKLRNGSASQYRKRGMSDIFNNHKIHPNIGAGVSINQLVSHKKI